MIVVCSSGVVCVSLVLYCFCFALFNNCSIIFVYDMLF